MGYLRILKVTYQGDKFSFESPSLDRDLAIIEGPNGSGKSTFFNLIYYGLGGKVDEFDSKSNHRHAEITGDENNAVVLQVEISGNEYSLVRRIEESIITIQPFQNNVVSTNAAEASSFPIFRRDATNAIFSDWLLEKLNIPVVELFQGGKSFKLNFTDLARLIYHNQKPDPQGVFKPADNSNFLSDSLEIRRVIFQILVGKSLLAFYGAVGKLKLVERAADSALNVLREYEAVVREVVKDKGIENAGNLVFIQTQISELDAQIDKLLKLRIHKISEPMLVNDVLQSFEVYKRRLLDLESSLRAADEDIAMALAEKARFVDVIRTISEDVERVSKVLFAHQNLNLFSRDTCPYCLSNVDRPEGKCVCGSTVDENDYQRFFYDANEYLDIFRAKQKSLQTVVSASEALDIEIERKDRKREEIALFADSLRAEIDASFEGKEFDPRTGSTEELDEKIFDLRLNQNDLFQALKMEQNIERLRVSFDQKKQAVLGAREIVDRLELESRAELSARISEFDLIYNRFMTHVLAECKSAKIDADTYLPVINDGLYREASAEVPKRFLYYLALLELSLGREVPFPKLLLVDTPETAGIDRENLDRMLAQILTLGADGERPQILLSTGLGKYPPTLQSSVVIRLSKEQKLLQPK